MIHAALGRYDRRLPEMAAKGVSSLTITAESIRGEKPAIRTTALDSKELAQLLLLRKHAGAYALWKKKTKEESVW